jgi:predicted transcriptional regulator
MPNFSRGTDRVNSSMSPDQVITAREMRKAYYSVAKIAEILGVSRYAIYRALSTSKGDSNEPDVRDNQHRSE